MADSTADLLRTLAMMGKVPANRNQTTGAPKPAGTPTETPAQKLARVLASDGDPAGLGSNFNQPPVNSDPDGLDRFFKSVPPPAASGLPSGGGFEPSSPFTPYSGPSGDAMAKNQYADQYALLNKMRGDTTTNYTNAGNEMGGIYEALAKQMAGQTAGIKQQYNASGTAIGNQYNSAIKQSDAGYDKSRSALSQMAKSLGIQQGLPGAQEEGHNQQNWLNGLMRANQANDVNTNRHMGNSEASFNDRNAQIENNMGASSRQDFKNRMLQALSGIDDKQLAVKSNQAESANKYNLDIASMNSRAKSEWDSNETRRQDNWNTNQTNQARNEADLGRLSLDSDIAERKFAAEQNKPIDQSKMNAYDLLAVDANTAYNGDPQDAQKAIKIIQDMWDGGWGGNKDWTSSSDFYNDVVRSNPAAASSQLSRLANLFYQKIAGGANKATVNGPDSGRMNWLEDNRS